MVDTVQFRAASALDIQGSSTATTVTIPASVAVGDYLVLHVVHRDTLTPPSGWSVLGGPTTAVEANQMQTVLVRTAQSGDAGTNVTCTQASSQRMLSHVQAFYAPDEQQVIASDIVSSTAAGLDLPQLSATYPEQMAVVSMSNVFAATSGDETITPPSGYTQTTPSAVEGNRLGAAYKSLGDSETISGRFENSSEDTDRTAYSLILGALRSEPAGTLVQLEQWTGGAQPPVTLVTLAQEVERHEAATTLVTLAQEVERHEAARTLVQLDQGVYVYTAAHTVVTLDQTVEFLAENAAGTLITLSQATERHNAAGPLATLRQLVLTNPQAPEVRTRVTLGGNDVTDITARGLTITATEGDARTARLRLRQLPRGPLDVPSYQGKAVTISRIIGGSLVALFTGTVERPTWDRERRQLVLECSDLCGERLAKEDHGRLQQMTGGLYSGIAQREDASGEQWVRELMKTVPGSLDYTSDGVLRYSPWAVGTPRYTLGAGDIHDKEVSLEFATRSEIVNRVPATLEYRYFKRNTITHAVALNVKEAGYCKLAGCLPAEIVTVDGQDFAQIQPSKEALLAAAEGVSDWHLTAFSYRELPPDGWYRNTSDATQKLHYSATDAVRAVRAMGADATLERYISQPQREVYDISVEAPQSIDQFGEIAGSELRVSAETRIDGSIYEQRGCTIVADPDDRRADVDLAIQSIQRQGERQILAAHRKNYAEVIYKGDDRDPLPVEIGDPISVDVGEIAATGTVTEFSHVMTESGDVYTTLKLAVSRVDSSVSVTEDWSLPAQPTQYRLNSDSQALPATPDCPAPTGEAEVSGPSRIEPDGTVIIIAPSVDRSLVDEIIGTRQHSYPVAIPKDTLTVEVS